MAVDAVQLLGVAFALAGIWLTAPAGIALILTGLIMLAIGLVIEHG